jgi:hypothetical protein
VALVVVIAWMAVVAFWATRPWSDTVALVVPKGKPAAFATFECSDPLGSPATPTHHGTLRLSPARTPCSDRSQRRALALADLVLGAVAVVGMFVTAAWRRSRPAAA